MDPVLTVTLNPAVDQTVHLPHFRAGETHRYQRAHRSAGGKGINVARTLRGLGVDCRATGFLGGSNGEYIRRRLREEKISGQFVPIKQDTRVSWTVIDEKTGRATRLLEDGPLISSRERADFQRVFRRLLVKSGPVVLSGRSVPGVGEGFYAALVRLCRRAGKQAVLDTSGEPLIRALAEKPFMIKPNREEAESLLKRRLATPRAVQRAARDLLARGPEVVIVSLGSEGAVAAMKEQSLVVRPPGIRSVSTVGCGDALIGGFLAALHKGQSFDEAVRWAVAAGTVNALHLQPGRITRKQLREILPQVKVEKV